MLMSDFLYKKIIFLKFITIWTHPIDNLGLFLNQLLIIFEKRFNCNTVKPI